MPPVPDVPSLVATRAAAWYPELAGRDLQTSVEHHSRRPQSEIVVVRVTDGVAARKVLVKAVFPLAGVSGVSGAFATERPRLGLSSAADLADKHRYEWRALERAWRAMTAGAPGLDAVRPLAHLDDDRTIILEYLPAATLRDRLWHGSRIDPRTRETELPTLLRRVGRWIATFHDLGDDVEAKRSTAGGLAEAAAEYGRFLTGHEPAHALAGPVASALAGLSEPLRLGLGHGDLAPRNVFVDRAGAVTIIDPLGRWRVPVEEDLAALLIDLRTSGAQTVLGGRAFPRSTLAALEAAFLEGYGENGVPVDRPRLEAVTGLVLLDRWAATLSRPTPTARSRATMALVRRRLSAETQQLLARLS